jgi:hypothetical protein
MRQDIARLESGKTARGLPKATTPDRAGYVYVLRASPKYDTIVKIGRTRDIVRRLREHTAALADDPEVLYVFKTNNADAVESCLKGWLRDRRWSRGRYKEVYKADLDIVKQLVHGCDLAGKVKHVPRTGNNKFAAVMSKSGGGTSKLFIAVV